MLLTREFTVLGRHGYDNREFFYPYVRDKNK